MKIGLITIFQVPNYGSVLQAFALQKVLESMGHECIIINYNYRNEVFYHKHGLKRRKIKELLLNNIPWLKSAKLNRFRKKNLNLSKQFETYEDLSEHDWHSYNAFIVGSDQVWNTNFLLGDPAFLLKFTPESALKISISSSFALKEIPSEYISLFKEELSKFHGLSVRESNGVSIINNCLGLDQKVKVTLDPTLLLSKEQWLAHIPRSSFEKRRPYILIYMLTYAFEPRPYIFEVINFYKNKLNADVIVLEGHNDFQNVKITFADYCRSSIPEFIDLFANADLVITSSFHGSAFAINFGIPLISIVPDNDRDDRQSSLLKRVGADNSIIKINTELTNINPVYNKDKVNKNLKRLRNETFLWISENLTF